MAPQTLGRALYNARTLGIAFFDLDRTLLSINSGSAWLLRELREGRLSLWQVARATYYLGCYRLGSTGLAGAVQEAISTLKGTSAAEMRHRAEVFHQRQVRGFYRPGGLRALADHKRRGDLVALLTSTMEYLAEPVARDLALDAVLCNRFEVDSAGAHTGRTRGGLCYGAGKLEHALAFAGSRGIQLEACVFYTDSIADMPLLERVGRPVVVNPDPRLRREAARRGWEVVDWGRPGMAPA